MCKKLIYLVSAFMVVGLIGPVAAQDVDMEIGLATQPPVIDGEVDGIWEGASTQYFVPLDDPANASGSWMVLYDYENLYVIVDMTDDSLQNDSASSWQDDSVELYFDGGNTKVNTPLSGDDHQYTFGWTTDDIQGTNIDGATEGIEHAQVDTDTGWRIEIKMPWLSIQGAAPQAGDLIGIDCYYNDDDDGGDSRENKLLSFSAVEGWNDASQWGTAILTAEPVPGLADPVHQYTFEDGTANDSVGSAHGILIGDAAVVDGALVLDGDGDWMEMPGEVIAMNTYSEATVETWFTSVAGGNTGFHMLAAFGEEGTGANPGFGYKYLFITPARGDDVSRAAIQTSSMDDSPWDEETGVSATVEHDDGLEHHFIATVDATNITFYIDGELIGSEPLAAGNEIAGIGQAVAFLGRGVYTVDPLWTGSVNEFNIYDRALSLAQVEANYAAGPVKPLVHQYTFEDGTANDSVGSAHGTLVGDATVVDGQLVLDGDGDWMDMPGDVIAMNTFEGLTIEIMFTSVAGGNTGYHMVTAFGEEGTGDNPGYGYKYVCITPARGNDVSRGMIQTVSMDDSPWDEETGVSDVIEHDDGLPHHMVCTVDNTELAFYVDGVLIGTAALDPPGNSIAGIGTDAAHIGKGVYDVDPLWAGSVEELNIYNRALSLAEVQANYAAGPQKVGPAPVDPGTEGLMLHLPLDTASRGVTQDSSDNDLDGTLFGDPTFVEGVVVMAMDFDGDGDYVDCGNDPILDITGPISMSIWIRPDTDGSVETAPLCKADASAGWSWQLRYGWNTDKPTIMGFQFNATGGRVWVYVEQDLPIGQWYHIAASHDGATVKCYLDGVETDSAPMTDFAGGPSTLLIGSDGWGSDWIGAIDEVMIYNRALSDLEILYLAGNR